MLLPGTADTSAPKSRSVILIGPTGVGKSFIGNKLLKKPLVFKSESRPTSVTKEVGAGEFLVEWVSIRDGEKKAMNLRVIDTPGLGDTEGRSLEFLDTIMQKIKEEQPDVIVMVVPADVRLQITHTVSISAFQACFGKAMRQDRILLLANKAPNAFTLENDFGIIDEDLQEVKLSQTLFGVKDRVNEALAEAGDSMDFSAILPNSAGDSKGVDVLRDVISDVDTTEKWNLSSVVSFTERLKRTMKAVQDENSLHEEYLDQKRQLKRKCDEQRVSLGSYKDLATVLYGAATVAAIVEGGLIVSAGPLSPLVYLAAAFVGHTASTTLQDLVEHQARIVAKTQEELEKYAESVQAKKMMRDQMERFLESLYRLKLKLQETAKVQQDVGVDEFDAFMEAYKQLRIRQDKSDL